MLKTECSLKVVKVINKIVMCPYLKRINFNLERVTLCCKRSDSFRLLLNLLFVWHSACSQVPTITVNCPSLLH